MQFSENILRLIEAIKEIRCKLIIVGDIDKILLEKLETNKIKYINFCLFLPVYC